MWSLIGLGTIILVRGIRLVALVWAVLFYGVASTYLLVFDVIPDVFG